MNLKWVSPEQAKSETYPIREEVFVEELSVPRELHFDDIEENAFHLVAYSEDGTPIGTARLHQGSLGEDFARISRLAIRKSFRRRGLASRLMALCEHRAKLSGFKKTELESHTETLAFYRKLGYLEGGPVFLDAGMPHQKMSKTLNRRVVIAVGGNAVVDGYESIVRTAEAIVAIKSAGWEVVLTHGNGPQVGAALLRSELSASQVPPQELATCVAETQGTMGYDFCRALDAVLAREGFQQISAAVITQTQVDPKDPAFANPTKPIGSFMSQVEAEKRRDEHGWSIVEDAGRGWRRVVPSPKPVRIIQAPIVRTLLEAGYLAVASGGGGIPTDWDGSGVSAVIDKDGSAALLAREVQADALLICTAVPNALLRFGQADEETLGAVSLTQMRTYLEEGHFKAGSMKPKVQACIDFLSNTAKTAIITDIDNLEDGLKLKAGTSIDPYF